MKNPDPYEVAKQMMWELSVLRITTDEIRRMLLSNSAEAAGTSIEKLEEGLKETREKAMLKHYEDLLEEAGFEPDLSPGGN